ncbi:hypothetical protein [Alkalicoccobacillus gibsonii]|uniref:hypothetical protein n=1 Tax=Alkalicoccobacillus gibsonii TaxID=79881 RepID=UPI0019321DB4|nr:hypothetical protein [Alkalicoccobacillus gibsonii]MBM0064766.1 hypothetical protein [Alkalicoccobacillus gibsonii]
MDDNNKSFDEAFDQIRKAFEVYANQAKEAWFNVKKVFDKAHHDETLHKPNNMAEIIERKKKQGKQKEQLNQYLKKGKW